MAGGVEDVCGLTLISGLRCWEAGMLRLGGGGPAKPITECDTIYIGLVRRVLSRTIYKAHEVMRMLGWWWWNSGNGRSERGAGFCPVKRKPSARGPVLVGWMVLARIVYRAYWMRQKRRW